MNTCLRRLALAVLALLPLCLSHAAFNPAIVPADAKWVLYADLKRVRESPLGKELITTARQKLNVNANEAEIMFDFDRFFAAVGQVTAYGANFGPKAEAVDGALVIEGAPALRKFAEGWAVQATLTKPERFKEVTGVPFPAYALGNELVVGFPAEPVILVSKSTPHLIRAGEVFRGQASSLAQAPDSTLARLLAKGGAAYGLAASVVPSEQVVAFLSGKDRQAPAARIFELTDTGVFSIGEEGQRTTAHAELVAKSSDATDRLFKIVQGLVAMISLTENNDRQLAEFLASAVIEKKGQSVVLELGYASDRLVQMLRGPQTAPTRPGRAPVAPKPSDFGRVVAEWKVDHAPPAVSGDMVTLTSHGIPNVRLATGSVLALTAQRQGSGNTLVDRIEIFPMSGGPGLRFELENMRTMGFSTVKRKTSSERVTLVGSARPFAAAWFEFPGAEGDYMIHVHYAQETRGDATLALSVKEPEAVR